MLKKIIPTACAALMVTSVSLPTLATNDVSSVGIKISGSKTWSAECTMEKPNGKTRTLERQGRGHRSSKSFTGNRVQGGLCEVNIPDGADVKVTFVSRPSMTCPFGDEAKACEARLKPGQSVFTFGGGTVVEAYNQKQVASIK
ncbi:hypothetical protein [Kordiimonas sp. SCSIO 12610]|uniref:hypothetical protein n=1 Tax=Kordiimonas sp. SCSIO 12610 TaxID=2829597 RepID=UPI00210B6C12|nr:hypothetical protein [Kordiimonas sp. SCSIO 12610]UTW54266.1 hypothetical protein KFF44_10590 [Kordiimonas sp. SCSIO 12610]